MRFLYLPMRIFGPLTAPSTFAVTFRSPGSSTGVAVAADEQDGRRERRAVLLAQAVDEQPLALADAVLLAGNLDDRVGHRVLERRGQQDAGEPPASRRMIPDGPARSQLRGRRGGRSPRSTPTSARTRQAPRRASPRTADDGVGATALGARLVAARRRRRRLLALAASARPAAGALLRGLTVRRRCRRRLGRLGGGLRRLGVRRRRLGRHELRAPARERGSSASRRRGGSSRRRRPPRLPRRRRSAGARSPASSARGRRGSRGACASSSAGRPARSRAQPSHRRPDDLRLHLAPPAPPSRPRAASLARACARRTRDAASRRRVRLLLRLLASALAPSFGSARASASRPRPRT